MTIPNIPPPTDMWERVWAQCERMLAKGRPVGDVVMFAYDSGHINGYYAGERDTNQQHREEAAARAEAAAAKKRKRKTD